MPKAPLVQLLYYVLQILGLVTSGPGNFMKKINLIELLLDFTQPPTDTALPSGAQALETENSTRHSEEV